MKGRTPENTSTSSDGLFGVARERHTGGANYTFADGHVKWERYEATIQPTAEQPYGSAGALALYAGEDDIVGEFSPASWHLPECGPPVRVSAPGGQVRRTGSPHSGNSREAWSIFANGIEDAHAPRLPTSCAASP